MPVKNLNELLLWKPGEDEFNVATQPLAERTEHGDEPLTLVCHDMMGGYIDDRFVQGVPKMDCYRFYHWQYLDQFVYFSHNFVSIPPPGWTNAAHRNGVSMLGTVITEWKEGAARCQEIFKSEAAFKTVADKLVQIAIYYNFEGWLINIENPIKPQHMPQLVDFVRYLTEAMHREKPGSTVIWYDSVIQDGSLKWQDMLNNLNSMFFDGSDGIFLNYTWNEKKLEKSVENSGDRIRDVFVGVDVFGRNCFGGGGWNTWKAMEVIRAKQLSAAIFAPGWVYECQPKENFIANQNRFWETQLGSYLYPHGVSSLPFLSNFCRGYGKRGYKFGKPAMMKQWCNFSAQQVQPTFDKFSGESQSLVHTLDDAYNGGGCIQLRGEFTPDEGAQLFRIFQTGINTEHSLLVSMTTKPDNAAGGCLVLSLSDGSKIILWPEVDNKTASEQAVTSFGVRQSAPLPKVSLPGSLQAGDIRVFGALVGSDHKALSDVFSGMDTAGMDSDGWIQQFYLLPESTLASGVKIESISVACFALEPTPESVPYSLKVGDVRICDPSELQYSSQQVTDIGCSDISWHFAPKAVENSDNLTTMCVTLNWNYEGIGLHYDVFCSGVTRNPNVLGTVSSKDIVFIGRAYGKCFRVCHLVVDDVPEEFAVTFYVQPTSEAGMTAPYDGMSRVKLICHK